jgi:ABC-2 type transport system ATP-binding protein/lipopolysaccharide transport system ATP-binding protein
MANAIEIDGVSKRYKLGEHHGTHGTLRDALASSARRLVRREPRAAEREIWSLRDISLAVPEGETLGVIGRNGAGKSTLLKVITRITEPTAGVSRTRGRVGALLEVGTGFHPELTGRENVYLNGAILGMSRRLVERRFDEIVDFAGVRPFLDTPVKRYSSGMYLRLAFAVAAHLEADILAIDEVLAVGDAEFQRKCLAKMGSLHAGGRTVVFVSHNLDAVSALCERTAWLEQGAVRAYGPTAEVIDAYLTAGTDLAGSRTYPTREDRSASLLEARIVDGHDRPSASQSRDEPVVLEVRFAVREPVPGLDLTVFVQNLRGVRVLEEAWSENVPDEERGAPGEYVARVAIPPVLAVGEYVAGLWLGSKYDQMFYEDDVLRFRLDGRDHGRPNRVVALGVEWDVRPAPPSSSARREGSAKATWTTPAQ